MDLGYARVSTREQDLTGQVAELQAAGCAKIYSEKASGARGDRAELARVIKRLQPGDVLVVTRLDRLARSTRDLLNVLEAVKQAGAGFRSLKDAWCDTTTPHGVLMLTVLGGLAEFERTLIRARTGEGRERAKGRGVRFGRPLKLSPHQRREAIERLDAGDAFVMLPAPSGWIAEARKGTGRHARSPTRTDELPCPPRTRRPDQPARASKLRTVLSCQAGVKALGGGKPKPKLVRCSSVRVSRAAPRPPPKAQSNPWASLPQSGALLRIAIIAPGGRSWT